jgi:hypothetical protein
MYHAPTLAEIGACSPGVNETEDSSFSEEKEAKRLLFPVRLPASGQLSTKREAARK